VREREREEKKRRREEREETKQDKGSKIRGRITCQKIRTCGSFAEQLAYSVMPFNTCRIVIKVSVKESVPSGIDRQCPSHTQLALIPRRSSDPTNALGSLWPILFELPHSVDQIQPAETPPKPSTLHEYNEKR